MNTRILKTVFVFFITLNFSCKQTNPEATLADYKYADQPETISCDPTNDKLMKEALYSFENDIINSYDPNGKNKLRAYRSFVNNATANRVDVANMMSKQTKAVFDVLKTKTELWDGTTLNYKSNLVKCLSNNIQDQNLKTTFNALVTTNSMSQKLFGPALRSNTSYTRDPYLQTFLALDYYYTKMLTLDFTQVDLEANEAKQQANNKIDFNKKPTAQPLNRQPAVKNKKVDDHAGHNH